MRTIRAYDIDHTLCEEVCYTAEQCRTATPILKRIEEVRKTFNSEQNYFVVLYTGRRLPLVEATLEWLEKYNVKFHAFQYGAMKMPFDEYVDADAIHPDNL